MTIEIKVSEDINNLRPVFIFAPTARNGITLIQRLLNSSRQIIIFGEDEQFIEVMPSMIISKAMGVAQKDRQEYREQFFNKSTEFWSSGLSPDDTRYLNTVIDNFSRTALFFQEWAKEKGYDRWGFKQPLSKPMPVEFLTNFFTGSKCIFLYRNLFDVARSSKARKWLKSKQDVINIATKWQNNLLSVLNNPHERIMVLRHEDLVFDPEANIKKIEEFTGITNIDRSVMDRKINTFSADSNEKGYSKTMYIKPEELSIHETSILYEYASKALELTGYKNKRL